jgi:hypothetical protein
MYARGLLLDAGESDELQGIVSVWPYAYAPSQASLDGLQALLKATLGTSARSELREPIGYGDEDTLREALTRDARKGGDWKILLMNLAATPEPEHHGAVIAALRDNVSRPGGASPLLIVIDEASYAARMRGDAALEPRMQERRRLWLELVAGHGLSACILDLSKVSGDDTDSARARSELHAALFSPREANAS